MGRSIKSKWSYFTLLPALCLGLITDNAQSQDDGRDFTVYLQTTGDWSGQYTGEEIGLSNHTVILYQWMAGQVPEEGPEYVDWDAHLESLEKGIERYVPQDFDGLIILDYERFPISLYHTGYKWIREPRIEAEKELDPEIDDATAKQRAEKKYQPAVQRFYLDTLKRARELRPQAKWGYYALVAFRQNPEHPEADPITADTESMDDRCMWLWENVDAITIPIYTGWFEAEGEHQYIEDQMPDKIKELVRLAKAVEKKTKHRPLTLAYTSCAVEPWGKSDYERVWVSTEQTQRMFDAAYDHGADGMILWQTLANNDERYHNEDQYITLLETQVAEAMRNKGLIAEEDGEEEDSPPDDDNDSALTSETDDYASQRITRRTTVGNRRIIRRHTATQTDDQQSDDSDTLASGTGETVIDLDEKDGLKTGESGKIYIKVNYVTEETGKAKANNQSVKPRLSYQANRYSAEKFRSLLFRYGILQSGSSSGSKAKIVTASSDSSKDE